jgi:hypothetical protein
MRTRHFATVIARLTAVASCLALSAACGGELLRTGRAPVYVVIGQMQAAAGSDPDTFGTPLLSDVQVLVQTTVNGQQVRVPTIFNDLGQATMRLETKDPTLAPTGLNQVTLTRYRVVFRRGDGRNTPGVDVPYPFDGGVSATLQPGAETEVIFDLVRHQAKVEAPLRNLVGFGGLQFISTVAEVTFWGRDQNGNEVVATGLIDVHFGDFGDED